MMNKVKFEDVEELVNLCLSLMFIPSPPDGTGGRTITITMVSTYRDDMSKILKFLDYTNISQIYSTLRYKKMWTKKYLEIAGVPSKLEWLSESVGVFDWNGWYKETLSSLQDFIRCLDKEFSISNFLCTAETIGISLEGQNV